jgi:hypothetical protein
MHALAKQEMISCLLLTLPRLPCCLSCSAEVEAAVRERQVVRNRQQLRNTLSSKQKGSSEQEAGEWHRAAEALGTTVQSLSACSRSHQRARTALSFGAAHPAAAFACRRP